MALRNWRAIGAGTSAVGLAAAALITLDPTVGSTDPIDLTTSRTERVLQSVAPTTT
jgi:hypothetical protein